ncbi:hypothetical protein SDC9_122659 [bioreactor metagenome]|uniref:Uncharacterized protein n=1 Tax=bioreactor metagenome TaxID=1076179 RepID=A0A645CFI8_9ZZZZ
MGHAVRLIDNNVQKAVGGGLRNVSPAAPQRLRIAADIGEGGTQLMRNVGDKLLASFLAAVMLRLVVQNHQHAAAGLVRKRGEVQFQRLIPRHHLRIGVVGPLKVQNLCQRINGAEQLVIDRLLRDRALKQLRGSGIAVDQRPVVVKGHHSVGHVKEQGIQLIPLVLNGVEAVLKHIRHVVECAGQNTDFVRGLHRQLVSKVSAGQALRPFRHLFDGADEGLAQKVAEQHRDQKSDHQRLHDDGKKFLVQSGDRVPIVKDIDDVAVLPAGERKGRIHIVCGQIAAVSHRTVQGRDEIGRRRQNRAAFIRLRQNRSRGAVQNVIVSGTGINAQETGVGLQNLLHLSRAVGRRGGGQKVGHESGVFGQSRAVRLHVGAEHIVHLLIKAVDIEAGHVGGQKRPHRRHQRGNQQQHDEHQLHMKTFEHGGTSLLRKSGGRALRPLSRAVQ